MILAPYCASRVLWLALDVSRTMGLASYIYSSCAAFTRRFWPLKNLSKKSQQKQKLINKPLADSTENRIKPKTRPLILLDFLTERKK
jgi:hypothetical protein